ncbi:voltage-gated chloride channel family protein [Leptospira sp. 96542]|nr:voltage-gated chloride channel family protein [Leptospira sp. 96542]
MFEKGKRLTFWIGATLIVGFLTGTTSAIFLHSLDFVTKLRMENLVLVYFLPLAGLIVGLFYEKFGQSVSKGNNQLLEEIQDPKQTIPMRMAPLVFIGTILTHLFGGSAGREGTAVQMGGALADQFSQFWKLNTDDRRILILLGISGGFASVFGTPVAGCVFALEVVVVGRIRLEALLPAMFTAIIADQVCLLWKIKHTQFPQIQNLEFSAILIFSVILLGFISGLVAMCFSKITHWVSDYSKRLIPNPILRPFVGGVAIVFLFVVGLSEKYLGLGVPTIIQSFQSIQSPETFLIKLIVTAITIGSGFKGGEVTPLFFIGASLGSSFGIMFDFPLEFFAAIGFVSVFAGATNTPIACTLMGIELFGGQITTYFAIACAISYFVSGHRSIYTSQIIGSPKSNHKKGEKGKRISEIF